jgi:hypothetical protein
MVRSLLIRGMAVGLFAGLLAFGFAHHFGEPQVQRAIDFESSLAGVHHVPGEPDLVSRHLQRSGGLLAGSVVLGVALGGMFSLTFAWTYGRVGAFSARATAALLALAAYLTVIVVPFTKYPANPPAIGNPDTISRRTLLYFLMIAISILSAVAAGRIRRQFTESLGTWNAALLAGAVFIVVIAVAQLVLPAVHETPTGFPADVLYRFRLASLGISATMWLTIGLGFGVLADRLLAPGAKPSRAADAAPA